MSRNSKEERLVEEVRRDYIQRREKRRNLEAQWQLNINFYLGNQYCYIRPNNNVADYDKMYFWQEKEVFNHIASTVETRLAKILQMVPEIAVRPASTDEADIQSAKLSRAIFNSVAENINLSAIIDEATTWSELCGTAFYKIIWNADKGLVFGEDKDTRRAIKIGDVDIAVCSPFEIFPDNLGCENIKDLRSIIHARAVDVGVIKNLYGVNVKPEKCYGFNLDNIFNSSGGLGYSSHLNKVENSEIENACLVIEKYSRPDEAHPNGRLTIIASDKLLFDGELPYIIGEGTSRDFPFVKQTASMIPGNFFGVSYIERLIPVQRAYNAIRNRKHEYFNRVSMGVLAVESGSVDTDALEQDGLSPGKVLVYRQGSKIPEIMETPNINTNFEQEEERLLDEFKSISGVNDLVKQDLTKFGNVSGSALELLIAQDEQRLQPSINSVKSCLKNIAKFVLRLYKQYAIVPRVLKVAGELGDIKLYYWDKNQISSDDVIIDASRITGDDLISKRSMLMDLINAGLMFDENGKFSNNMRKKCLDLLGFGIWENSIDIHSLQMNRAQKENFKMQKEDVDIMELDEHETHINEHLAYLLGSEVENATNREEIEKRLIKHINEHKKLLNNSEK